MRKSEVENKIWQKDIELLVNDLIYENFSNQTILITGATGLIGSELVFSFLCANRIKNLNIKVFALVRNEKKAKEIFKNVLNDLNFNILIQDIIKPIKCSEKIDYIFHCANMTNSKQMIKNPTNVIETTVSGTKSVLDFAKEIKVKDLIYLSSIEIYGQKNDKKDVFEDDYGIIDVQNVRSCYPLSKKMAENLCLSYAEEFKINVKIARLTQTFGAGISKEDERVFAQFAKSIIENKDIVLKTDGLSYKNYCYITDCVLALLYIAQLGKNKEIYNVANYDSGITIKDLALKLIDKYKTSNLKFEMVENSCYPKNSYLKLNSKKLENLGWKAEIGLDEMFDRLINYIKEGY